jgi:ABC-type polysaccharide/polyol phosphate transport system ATPase subunit
MIDLRFKNVSKEYRIRQGTDRSHPRRGLARRLMALRTRSEQFWALRDVSFEVNRGESLGIIGHNGAGKSTILKLLSKITAPTAGEIRIQGRLSALIEVGSGFHPELTGRENVYLSGSILGMRRREITTKLDSIIDFAGVRQFIDTPVKRYSSGMYVRLGFSIAAHLQPDILLLDEVLAVGDAAFQAKCFKRISELKVSGTTIVFISHDLNAVELLCDRALLLKHGEIAADGSPRDVLSEYEHSADGSSSPRHFPGANFDSAPGPVEITRLTFHNYEGSEVSHACTGSTILARVGFVANQPVADVVFEVFYYSQSGKLHCQFSTSSNHERVDLDRGEGAVEFSCPELGLQPGLYYADATIKWRETGEEIDWQYRCSLLRIDPGKNVAGSFYAPHEWRITQHNKAETSSQFTDLLIPQHSREE